MDTLTLAIQGAAALLTICGIAYGLIALLSALAFENASRSMDHDAGFAPPVSVLKPVRGVDARMYAGLVSHCLQEYAGEVELLFGVSSLEDPAVALIARLRIEYPKMDIRLVECPLVRGMNGKASNLAQMVPRARFEHVVVNDSDIRVSPRYLSRVMAPFAAHTTGLVTVPYIGRAEGGLWSRLEALGISTDFMVGVLTARRLEGGIRFGLGSTLATTKSALASIGGFDALAPLLADDYELGARLSAAGYRVELVHEVVQTAVPRYLWRGFCEHQMRWARGTRDSRRAGYLGLGITYMVPWALASVLASGFALWSLSLLSLTLLVRVAVALMVGVGVLNDEQVLHDILLLPLRDCLGLFFWAWSYAGDEVVWRGERFLLQRGELQRIRD
jgi:ceramide glucosyltransferase